MEVLESDVNFSCKGKGDGELSAVPATPLEPHHACESNTSHTTQTPTFPSHIITSPPAEIEVTIGTAKVQSDPASSI